MQFIVLSSSRGTTFQSVIDALTTKQLTATCLGLITDRADRGCIEKAKLAGIPFLVVEKREDEDRTAYDKRLHEAILSLQNASPRTNETTMIATLGWMFIVTPWFVSQWKNRIVNVHPALLPKHGGKGMYGIHVHQAVLEAQEQESGISIHLVDDGVDTGKILLQKHCPVLPEDTPEALQKRVQELEKEWYPKVLQMIETGSIAL
jgi:formyltetrahydrofolate-dependent phosphoribosylglycinamide formyltransferase